MAKTYLAEAIRVSSNRNTGWELVIIDDVLQIILYDYYLFPDARIPLFLPGKIGGKQQP